MQENAVTHFTFTLLFYVYSIYMMLWSRVPHISAQVHICMQNLVMLARRLLLVMKWDINAMWDVYFFLNILPLLLLFDIHTLIKPTNDLFCAPLHREQKIMAKFSHKHQHLMVYLGSVFITRSSEDARLHAVRNARVVLSEGWCVSKT